MSTTAKRPRKLLGSMLAWEGSEAPFPRQYWYSCTSKASKASKASKLSRRRRGLRSEGRLLRQYLYFCTSKASKLSTGELVLRREVLDRCGELLCAACLFRAGICCCPLPTSLLKKTRPLILALEHCLCGATQRQYLKSSKAVVTQ